MTPRKPPASSKRAYQKHGLTQAKHAIRVYGAKILDNRTRSGKALSTWRESLIADLGGEDAISTQQRTLVELAARQMILLDVIDGFLFGVSENPLANVVNKSRRQMFAIARERQQLSDALARYLSMLGLERKAKVYDLGAYVVERYGEGTGEGTEQA